MNETKHKILTTALKLFNDQGVANTSIRQIAQHIKISHSNLIYHFPTQQAIVLALHDSLLTQAKAINTNLTEEALTLNHLFNATKQGFAIVNDYRFLFKDLLWICTTFPEVKEVMLTVENVRAEMYENLIDLLIKKKLIHPADEEDEYAHLIHIIKIYSDHWPASAAIYDTSSKSESIEKYAYLFMTLFYPYLTPVGKTEFAEICRLYKIQ